MKHKVSQELDGIITLLAIMWGVFFVDLILPGSFSNWGIVPRTAWGLIGIPLSPFLHSSWSHLISNSISLMIVLAIFAGSRAQTWETAGEIVLLGGGLLWLFGRNASHAGASLLIYGLIAYLLMAGYKEKRPRAIMAALLVGLLFGGSIIWGLIPGLDPKLSWDGHLCGAVVGAGLAYFNPRLRSSSRRWRWFSSSRRSSSRDSSGVPSSTHSRWPSLGASLRSSGSRRGSSSRRRSRRKRF